MGFSRPSLWGAADSSGKRGLRRGAVVVGALACVAALAALAATGAADRVPAPAPGPPGPGARLLSGPPAPAAVAGRFPRLSRVALIVLENRSYDEVIGSPQAPFLNRLARRHGLATNYYAVGHPSLPNYLAMTAGSTFGVRRDCNACDYAAPTLADQLDAAQISWKAYFESLPSPGFAGARAGNYSKHFNPFAYSAGPGEQPERQAKVVALTQLRRDLRARERPRFMWIAPNLVHDGHNGSVRASDRFMARLVPEVVRGLGRHGVLFITWDEAHGRTGPAGGHVALITAGGAAGNRQRTAVPANHYSLLRTIEAGFGLPALKRAAAPTTPLLAPLLKAAPTPTAAHTGRR